MTAKDKSKIVMVLDNLRSIHNVGAIMRTANGFGVYDFIFIGTTPYPMVSGDPRPPFMAKRQTDQLHKTSLGAEMDVVGLYFKSTNEYLESYANSLVQMVSVEQSKESIPLKKFERPTAPLHIILGNEVVGVSQELLSKSDTILEIPMQGTKESFNVEATAAMVLYQLSA